MCRHKGAAGVNCPFQLGGPGFLNGLLDLTVRLFAAAWLGHAQQKRTRKPVVPLIRSADTRAVQCEIPPKVLEARAKLGWNDASGSVGQFAGPVVLQSLGTHSDNAESVPADYEPSVWLNKLSMRTEAGEVLKRRRLNGPWFPDNDSAARTRGSADLALSVASNPVRAKNAVKQFESLMFNSGTVATKDSLFTLWSKLCQALGFCPLPLSRESNH